MFGNKKIVQPGQVLIQPSRLHGLGVFAKESFRAGRVIEEAPAVFLSADEKEQLKHSRLFQYYFLVNDTRYPAAFGFGYSAFYNHSNTANAVFSFSRRKKIIVFRTARRIESGEEITINYNGSPMDPSPVYFPASTHD